MKTQVNNVKESHLNIIISDVSTYLTRLVSSIFVVLSWNFISSNFVFRV